jgi:glyoxylase-like metal-dependent hydrolase (beta-lactamase superfamily II)
MTGHDAADDADAPVPADAPAAATAADSSVPAAPVPPPDPRAAWDLPAFGAMAAVEVVEPGVTRVLAPNPSPMTLDGTNTYVVFAGGGAPAVVVDPGPADDAHRSNVDQVIAEHDLDVAAVFATHHHPDHVAAAADWAADWGVQVVAARPDVAGPQGRVVADGDLLRVGELRLDVVATPGHTADSLSLRLPTRSVVTGDHVLGRGTAVVAHPDGTLGGYLDSLRRVLDLGPASLLPGHGPVVDQDPEAVLRYYLAHRAHRLTQVLDVLAAGPATAREVVEVVYADHDEAVWPAATASTEAAFAHLGAEGRIHLADDGTARLA